MTADFSCQDNYWREQLGELYDQFYASIPLGVGIDSGWNQIYVDTAYKIKELLDLNPINIKIMQVKSKLAGLRIYFNYESQEGIETTMNSLNLIIQEAAQIASKTCESCGNPGTRVSTGGWVRITCGKHR